ncbi:MAG: HAD family hydrolase [Candidatus Nanohalobium sp.]
MEFGSVVFDMDGVILNSLIDNEEWKFKAVEKALRDVGVEPEKLSRGEKRALLGDKGYSQCVKTSKEVGVDPRKAWSAIAEQTSMARSRQMEEGNFELYPGVRDLIEGLHDEGVELGIISNAPESAVKLTIEHFDLKRFFKFYAGVRNFEDLQARKPHPNHLELAKAELKRSPFVYVGDAESDLIAARRAGMDSIWVKRGEASHDVEPDYTIDSVEKINEIVLD